MEETLTLRAEVLGELAAPLQRAKAAVRDLDEAVGDLGRKAGGPAEQGLSRMERTTQRLRETAGHLDTRLRTLSRTVGQEVVTWVRRGTTALAAMATTVAYFGVRSSSNLQQVQLAFNTLLGSVEKGKALFQQVQALNLKTPFQLKDLAANTQLLLRYNVAGDKVISVIKGLADAAALTTDPTQNLERLSLAVGQVVAKGHLSGEEARQLAEAGIPAYELYAQKLGKTRAEVEKLGEAGKLSSDILINGIINAEGPLAKLQGGAEKMSTTLMGQLSNVKDALSVGLADAAQPLTAELGTLIGSPDKPGVLMTGLQTLVSTAGPPLFQLLGGVANLLSRALPAAAPVLNAISGGLERLLSAAGPALAELEPLGGVIGDSLTKLADGLVPVMPDLVALLGQFIMLLPDLVTFLTMLIPLVMPIVRLTTALLGFGPVRGVVSALLTTLLGYRALSSVVGAISAFSSALWGQAAAQEAVNAAAAGSGPAAAVAGAGGLATVGRVAAGLAAGAGSILVAGAAGTIADNAGRDKATRAANTQTLFAGNRTDPRTGLPYNPMDPLPAGWKGPMGDAVAPRRLAGTLAADGAVEARTPGSRVLTSSLRSFAVTGPGSGHVQGRSVDRAGSYMASYREGVMASGGWATQHGGHVHAEFGDTPAPTRGRRTSTPYAGSMPGGGAPLLVVHGNVYSVDDLQALLEAAARKMEAADRARGRSVQGKAQG